MTYLSNDEYRRAKTRLTRATNKAKRANSTTDKIKFTRAIVAEVNATFDDWDNRDAVYPDDWHRWNIARDDARRQLWVWNVSV